MSDLMGLETIREINKLFTQINHYKKQLLELPRLQAEYAQTVNELYEISIDDSQGGEEVSARALQLGNSIQELQGLSILIERLELQLHDKYGFPIEEQEQAA